MPIGWGSRRTFARAATTSEFTTNKDGVAAAAKDFKTDGWKITVGGLCAKPRGSS